MSPTHTLATLLERAVTEAPDSISVIDGHPTDSILVSRAELAKRVADLTGRLAAAGVGPGDAVAVWLPNWSDSLVWQFATASLGGHVVGMNTRYNIEEAQHVFELARPTIVAVAHGFRDLDLLDRLSRAVSLTDAPAPIVAPVAGPRGVALDAAARQAYDLGAGVLTDEYAPPAPVVEQADQLVVAFTTSGSTGKPKLAAHSSAAVAGHSCAVASGTGLGPGSVVLVVLPLTGVFGFNPTMAAIAGGATCLLEPEFDDAAVAADIARHRVTHFVGADDLVIRLRDAIEHHDVDVSSWCHMYLGDLYGRSQEMAQWLADRTGGATMGIYGSSELFALTAFRSTELPEHLRGRAGGRLVPPGMSVRTVDPETREVCSVGEPGELQFRGPSVVDAYLGAPEAYSRAFTPDGWFGSGDLGSLDEDGGLTYICRIGDALRLRGFLVEPGEIEACLVDHPDVEMAKVVGVRTASGETIAVGFVTLADGAETTGAQIRAWCAARIAGFKVPSEIRVIARMPTTTGTNGLKIRVGELRRIAQDEYERKHG